MDPKWHIAFCNVTYTTYAGVSYRDYYGSPAVMYEAQLAAKAFAEQRWGVGRFIHPAPDSPPCVFASFLGVPVIDTAADEIPYLDTSRPLLSQVADAPGLRWGDPRAAGWMGRRYEAWQYYRERGYQGACGGYDGGIATVACEITNGAALGWLLEDPTNGAALLDFVADAQEAMARFSAATVGAEYHGFGYTGDDYAGLLSPAMFREFIVPRYQRLYAGQRTRFMHSELLRVEHLRICRDEVGITEFHGAGCKLLTNAEMYEVMGERFWTQLTPQEMAELTPAQIDERLRELAHCGCSYVQLYPGRDTPAANLDAAIAAVQRECPGGPHW